MAVPADIAGLSIVAAGIGIRLLTAVVFATGVAHKLRNRLEFTGVLTQYRLLPRGTETFAAWLVITLELVAVASIAIAPTTGAMLASLLLCGYALAIAINLMRGRADIDCGCGGDGTPLSWGLAGRNVGLSALLMTVVAPAAMTSIHAGQAIAGVLFGAGLLVLYFIFEQLQVNGGIHRRLWLGR